MAEEGSRDRKSRAPLTEAQRDLAMSNDRLGHLVLKNIRPEDLLDPLIVGTVLGIVDIETEPETGRLFYLVPQSDAGLALAGIAAEYKTEGDKLGYQRVSAAASSTGVHPVSVLRVPASRAEVLPPLEPAA